MDTRRIACSNDRMSDSPAATTTTTTPLPSPLGTPEPWDLVAAAYAVDALPYFELFSRAALDRTAPPRGARIADVAAGPGTLTLLAAQSLNARVSAIDFSENMVAALRARVAAAGVEHAVDVTVGDGQQLPFESGAYDAAFSMFGLMFFPDRSAGLRELRRILKPGGRAIVSSWVPFDGPFGAIMKTAAEFIPGMPLGGPKPPLASPDEIRAEMTAAGFGAVEVDTIAQELKASSFDAFWTAMERTNAPLVLLRHRVGAERWTELGPKIRERLRGALGDGPLVVGRGAYLGIATA
jgi:SAM-dependent methyltransferase